MNLLADSSAWLALYDRRDKYHAQAKAAFERSVGETIVFVVSDLIWVETVTLLRYRSGHKQATLCGDWLLHSPLVQFVQITPQQWNEAWSMFKRYEDKDYSFTDCVSAIVMRQLNLAEAFSFDHHFTQMGFQLWPR